MCQWQLLRLFLTIFWNSLNISRKVADIYKDTYPNRLSVCSTSTELLCNSAKIFQGEIVSMLVVFLVTSAEVWDPKEYQIHFEIQKKAISTLYQISINLTSMNICNSPSQYLHIKCLWPASSCNYQLNSAMSVQIIQRKLSSILILQGVTINIKL